MLHRWKQLGENDSATVYTCVGCGLTVRVPNAVELYKALKKYGDECYAYYSTYKNNYNIVLNDFVLDDPKLESKIKVALKEQLRKIHEAEFSKVLFAEPSNVGMDEGKQSYTAVTYYDGGYFNCPACGLEHTIVEAIEGSMKLGQVTRCQCLDCKIKFYIGKKAKLYSI